MRHGRKFQIQSAKLKRNRKAACLCPAAACIHRTPSSSFLRPMSQRLKVLISAYACEPGKGSEPEVGWQLALHMARLHDVTVLTRANNRQSIETGLASHDGPHPKFIYYDLP